jgi:hypothetical protein
VWQLHVDANGAADATLQMFLLRAPASVAAAASASAAASAAGKVDTGSGSSVGNGPLAVVVAGGPAGGASLTYFNPLTGAWLDTVRLPHAVSSAFLLPESSSASSASSSLSASKPQSQQQQPLHTRRILLLVDAATNRVHVHPRTRDAIRAARRAAPSLFFHRADIALQSVHGYAIAAPALISPSSASAASSSASASASASSASASSASASAAASAASASASASGSSSSSSAALLPTDAELAADLTAAALRVTVAWQSAFDKRHERIVATAAGIVLYCAHSAGSDALFLARRR